MNDKGLAPFLSERDKAEAAQMQAAMMGINPYAGRLTIKDTQLGVHWEVPVPDVVTESFRLVELAVPYPGEWRISARVRDRGGWQVFSDVVKLCQHSVAVQSDSVERVTMLLVDGKAALFNAWSDDVDLYHKPPLHETVSWWRW